MTNITDNFQAEGFVEQRKELEKLMMSNPSMEKKVQKIISTVLKHVRKDVSIAAKGAMSSDPRNAYKAVKTTVYKRILGGSVSILNRRRASGRKTRYEPSRKLRAGQRGGNRVPRSERTQQVMSYEGVNRSFVLRFLQVGTNQRTAGTRGGGLSGNRGRITSRNFFSPSSEAAMRKAVAEVQQLIDELIKKETV